QQNKLMNNKSHQMIGLNKNYSQMNPTQLPVHLSAHLFPSTQQQPPNHSHHSSGLSAQHLAQQLSQPPPPLPHTQQLQLQSHSVYSAPSQQHSQSQYLHQLKASNSDYTQELTAEEKNQLPRPI